MSSSLLRSSGSGIGHYLGFSPTGAVVDNLLLDNSLAVIIAEGNGEKDISEPKKRGPLPRKELTQVVPLSIVHDEWHQPRDEQ